MERNVWLDRARDNTGDNKLIVDVKRNDNVKLSSSRVYFFRNSMKSPYEVWSFKFNSNDITADDVTQATNVNTAFLSKFEMSDAQSFLVPGSKNEFVHCWFLKPYNYTPGKTYPLVHLVHGGPQESWGDDWSYRWNPQLFSAAGFAVIMVNFHGSTGFGQNYTNAIRGNWGGYPFWDLLNATSYILKK